MKSCSTYLSQSSSKRIIRIVKELITKILVYKVASQIVCNHENFSYPE